VAKPLTGIVGIVVELSGDLSVAAGGPIPLDAIVGIVVELDGELTVVGPPVRVMRQAPFRHGCYAHRRAGWS
jgi:hypothetical protein